MSARENAVAQKIQPVIKWTPLSTPTPVKNPPMTTVDLRNVQKAVAKADLAKAPKQTAPKMTKLPNEATIHLVIHMDGSHGK